MEAGQIVVKNGYLEKRGKMNPAWQRRWFVAQGDKLYYFKTNLTKKPSGCIPLHMSAIRTGIDDDRENTIHVITKDRVFKLAAPTRDEMFDWIEAILPSTCLHEENKSILESEISIRETTRTRALEIETQYYLDYQLKLKREQQEEPSPTNHKLHEFPQSPYKVDSK